jgi:hypothetical protein
VPVNSEPIIVGVCPAGDRSSRSTVTISDVSCILVRYDEDYSIEGSNDMPVMRFPTLAGVCADFIGPNPGSGMIVEKFCK